MHVRVPAAGHAERTNFQRARRPVGELHIGKRQAEPPLGVGDLRTREDLIVDRRRRIFARVDDGCDFYAFGVHICGSAVTVVIVGKDRDAPVRCHSPAVGITSHRRREHDAGAVVIFKPNRALSCACTKQRFLGVDAPQNLAWLACGGHGDMVADSFDGWKDAMIKRSDNSGARHNADIWHGRQFGHGRRGPIAARLIADCKCLAVQATPHAEIFVRNDNLRAGPACSQGGGKSGRACPNNQQIAVQEPFVIQIRVVLFGQRPKASGMPNNGFIQFFPKRGRPHEGFVIESSSQEIRQTVVDCQ